MYAIRKDNIYYTEHMKNCKHR